MVSRQGCRMGGTGLATFLPPYIELWPFLFGGAALSWSKQCSCGSHVWSLLLDSRNNFLAVLFLCGVSYAKQILAMFEPQGPKRLTGVVRGERKVSTTSTACPQNRQKWRGSMKPGTDTAGHCCSVWQNVDHQGCSRVVKNIVKSRFLL